MENNEWLPNEQNIKDYALLRDMLKSLAIELRSLSSKKQEGMLSVAKVKMVNRILKPLKGDILAHEPSHTFLDLLDEDALPTNSDAVLVISQYETALEQFKRRYYTKDPYQSKGYGYSRERWMTEEKPPDYYAENTDEEEDDEDEEEEQ